MNQGNLVNHHNCLLIIEYQTQESQPGKNHRFCEFYVPSGHFSWRTAPYASTSARKLFSKYFDWVERHNKGLSIRVINCSIAVYG